MTSIELGWAAGILEVSGTIERKYMSYQLSRIEGYEVTERLRQLFGGKRYPNKSSLGNWYWVINGAQCRAFLMTMLGTKLLSPRRTTEIKTALLVDMARGTNMSHSE